MIITGLILPGFALVCIGWLIAGLQCWPGWFTHRSWYRHLPKFFISSGLMLPIGVHAWLDRAILFILWLIVDLALHLRSKVEDGETLSE